MSPPVLTVEQEQTLLAESSRLNDAARRKFGAGDWWVTARGLEQATSIDVARLKASWIKGDAVDDFACGVGGDALGQPIAREVRLVDRDPVMVAAASHNRVEAGGSIAGAVVADVGSVERRDVPLLIDPDRRPTSTAGGGERRVLDVDRMSPPWDTVVDLIRRRPATVCKLAPATPTPRPPVPHHAAWIARGMKVREQTLLTGDAIPASVKRCERSAWTIRHGAASVFADDPRNDFDGASEPRAYLVDPPAAVRAAGLTEAFGAAYGLAALGGPAGFWTTDDVTTLAERSDTQYAAVRWTGGMDDRKLRRSIRRLAVGIDNAKVRGGGESPETLVRRYAEPGAPAATLWIGVVGRRRFAAVTDPPLNLSHTPSPAR